MRTVWNTAKVLIICLVSGCTAVDGGGSGTGEDLDFQHSSNLSAEMGYPKIFQIDSDKSSVQTIFGGKNHLRSNLKAAAPDRKLHQVSLDKVPIRTAARLILHDKFDMPVQIDSDVTGTITLEARNGITSDNLLRLFGLALRHNGANLTISGKLAIITKGEVFPLPRHQNGSGITIFHLDYISSNDFVDLISSMVGQSLQVRSDPASNSIIISGPSLSVEGLLELAREMDTEDWRLASYALVPVDRDTGAMTASLMREVFAGSTTPTISIGYIDNLSALWVVGASDLSIERAKTVITQFENFSSGSRRQRFVWPLKSANAEATVKILNNLLSRDEKSDDERSFTRSSNTGSGDGSGGDVSFGNLTTSQLRLEDTPPIVIASPDTNSIIFEITQNDWSRLLPLLLDLDRQATQVHISVTILEIILTDSLSYGLQHALSFGQFEWLFSTTQSTAFAPGVPGLAISIDSVNIDLFLDQLSTLTDLSIVSTPNLMVRHGTTGTIKVGDQVPTLQSTTADGDDSQTTKIQYRSTGLSLSVTPFVDGREQVQLAVKASYDSAGTNSTSGIDSPVIDERSLDTNVITRSNQTIILGGLRKQTKENSQKRVPFLKRLPALNRIVGSTSKSRTESELVILLTPRVMTGTKGLDALTKFEIKRVAKLHEKLGATLR